MIDLPSWCDNPIGRALVEQIIGERPSFRLSRGQWIEGGGQKSYPGEAAGQLRRMHKDFVEREYAALNRQFAVLNRWDHERAREVLGVENGNELITRILAETEQHHAERRAA